MSVALILLAAIAFRIVYLLQYKGSVPYFSVPIVDSQVYDAWAQRLVAGEGYGPKPFYMAPFYPYLLALLYKIAGHKLLFVYLLQAVVGALSLFLVYILGRRISGHRAGLFAMVFLAFYAPLVYLESKLLTETLAVALNLTSILLVMRALDRPMAARFLIAGLALGMSIICRPAALITAALVVVWLVLPAVRMRHGIRARFTALLVIGIAATILPITVRNYVVGKDFAVITTNAGIVFAQGNSRSSTGFFASLPEFSGSVHTEQEEGIRLAGEALGHPVKPSECSSYWLGYGLRYIREHPGSYAALLLRKVVWSLHNGESACVCNVYLEKQLVPALRLLFMPFSALLALGLFGIAHEMRRNVSRDARLLALPVLSIFLSLLLFSVSSRFRAPAAAPLAVFAGVGLSTLIGLAARRDLRGLGMSVVCMSPVFLVSLVPYPKPYITAEAPLNLATAFLSLNRTEEAIIHLERALDMQPDHPLAHLNMGRALAKQERYEPAVEHYEQALADQPDNAEAHYYLGYALANLGRSDEAAEHYRESLRLHPANADARFNLGVPYDMRGETEAAIGEYRAAVRLSREHGGEPHPEFVKSLASKMPEPGR